MIIPVNKEKIMDEFKAKYVEGRFREEFLKMYEKFNEDKEIIREKIIFQFKEVCKKAIKIREQELKGDIKYIYISYLRTSIMQDLGIYRIDLYDDKWFLDKEECSVNIDLSFIYEPLFNYVKKLLKKRKEYGRTITEMDIEKIKLKEGDKYHKIGTKIFEELVNDLIECIEYKEMKKSEQISIFVGEYLDKASCIYKKSDEK
ncbi:MAG: hypothetical protein E7206_24485 [Clostridium beijerinckii]|nr:hypothetical protein [Clostridium beijerinckii]